MPVSPYALQDYMELEPDNWDWLKKISEKKLDAQIAKLRPQPQFESPLWKHQKACFLIGINNPHFMFFLDMGVGKSRITLEIIKYRKLCNEAECTLILVPTLVTIQTWVDEVAKFAPDLKLLGLQGTNDERIDMLNDDADFYAINYQGLTSLTTENVVAKKGKGKKKKWAINRSAVTAFRSKFDSMVCDEITSIKNHQSLWYRSANLISDACTTRFGLTGTPFGSDPGDLWAQYHCIDKGDTLGQTLGIFQAGFFNKEKNHFSNNPYHFIHTFDKRKKVEFRKRLKHRSIRYLEDECQELPAKAFRKVYVKFTGEMEVFYNEAYEELIAARGNYDEMRNSFTRMRQLASGFMTVKNEEEKIQIKFKEQPKLDATMGIIDSIGLGRKIVIFNEYVHSGNVICEELKRRKYKHIRIYSGTKDHQKELAKFNNDPDCRVAVVNHQSGAMSLNLQIANYVIYYESPTGPVGRQQSIKRCHRGGQDKRVFFYDIIMKRTVDERIQMHLEAGKDLMESLFNV